MLPLRWLRQRACRVTGAVLLFAVLTPFRLQELVVSGERLQLNGQTLQDGRWTLQASGDEVVCKSMRGRFATVPGPIVTVQVPGIGSRRYLGNMTVTARSGRLYPILSMEIENAVRAIVAAEMPDERQPEALKAQAIVTRSYLRGSERRHPDSNFCDTTHCQWLKNSPDEKHVASAAASATSGLVLKYQGKVLAPMFTRACAGKTHSAKEIGLPGGGYPFFAVQCERCRRDPLQWREAVSVSEAASLRHQEKVRLQLHRAGISVESNDYEEEPEGGRVILNGRGSGHGVGLCQRGASGMAQKGFDAWAILRHYFPRTTIQR